MCRWLAYSGSPIRIEDLLFKPSHSLIDQSLRAKFGAETTNGDGFGLGWYANGKLPGLFRSTEPAWNDRNLVNISRHIESHLFLAHVRASSGGAIQQTNCHPFRHQNWLWMHNGAITDFPRVKRELILAVNPELYPEIEGSTDSEVFFYLALSFGLKDDPPTAVERAVGFIEHIGHKHGIRYPIQLTVATSDGTSLWAFRYSSESDSRTLFYSTDASALKRHFPDSPMLQSFSDDSRLIVSEPLSDLEGAWKKVPESSWGCVRAGEDELHRFRPRLP